MAAASHPADYSIIAVTYRQFKIDKLLAEICRRTKKIALSSSTYLIETEDKNQHPQISADITLFSDAEGGKYKV